MADEPAKVAIYGAQWCPPCHAAKAYLNSRNIAYDYIDIDTQQDRGREIAMKTGWSAIPIIKIGEEYMLGFDRPKIDAALQENKFI
jgi:glutaredoxin 3